MTKQTLTADIDAFVRKSEDRLKAMYRYAISDMVNDMQTPVAKGGRMRVDTGFLRASAGASLEGMPSGNGQKPADAPTGQYTGAYDNFNVSSVTAVVANMNLGDTMYFGWVANYAPVRNTYDGFMDLPLQDWQGYVDRAVAKVKKDVG